LSVDRPRAVLFVCTFNRVRSPMAAGLVRRLYGDAVRAESCGLAPGEDVDPLAAAVMAEIGVDLSAHLPQRLENLIDEGEFDLIVALSADAWTHVGASIGGIAALHWPTPDPTEGEASREMRLEAFRLTRRELEARIIDRFGPPQYVVARGA
jgi:protein-tyrosine-phosphatase